MKVALILYDKIHQLIEADAIPDWPPYPDGTKPLLIDVTNVEAKEGDDYDIETGAITPPSPPPLNLIKQRRVCDIAADRWQAEVGGTEYAGLHVYTDRESQAKYIGAVVAYNAVGQLPDAWKCVDGWLPIKNADELMALAMAVQTHVQMCYRKEERLQELVEAAETIEEVGSVVWDEVSGNSE